MHKPVLFRIALLTLVALATWISSASAYEDYATAGVSPNRTGACADCHGDFRAPNYASLSDGALWTGVYSGVDITSLHDIHRRLIISGCDTCHTAGGRLPTHLDSSTGILVDGNQEYTISCLGCHGRAETNAAGEVNSAGLRQHHYINGETGCLDCHSDSNPAAFTTVGENVLPPYYAFDEPTRLKPSDPCNADGNETFAGATGLDNDGDGLYDTADPDCQFPDINLNPAALNFGVVATGNSAALNTAIENLGLADLTVSAIALCAGTSAEFSWTLATPFTVTPNLSEILEVTYTPVDAGADTGCLEISSDDPDEAVVQLGLSSEEEGSNLLPLFIPAIIRPSQP